MKNTISILLAVSLQGMAFAQAPNINYTTPHTFSMGTSISPLSPTNTGGPMTYGKVTTFAGSGIQGSTNGPATVASFYGPYGVAVDAQGNVYVTDSHKVRKISQSGTVSTLAGSGATGSADGTGALASFHAPYGVAVDAKGNVYVADEGNHKIRKISPSGTVSTLAGSGTMGSTDGTGASVSFYAPNGVEVDAQGNVYVADTWNLKIRKISPAGTVSTLAGNGTQGSADGAGNSASFYIPCGIEVDAQDNVYVADTNNNKIRKISPSGMVSTLAGSGTQGFANGTGASARFYSPCGVAVDAQGNVYVADTNNNKIRKISPSGTVSTLAGNGTKGSADGAGNSASFNSPIGVAVDAKGNVYIADTLNNKIRKIEAGGYTISPALPAGLSIDALTGSISGTPAVVSPQTTYTVSATNSYGTSTTRVIIAVNALLGIEDITFKNMVVYPNPTTGEVSINNIVVEKVNVFNNSGQLVKTVTNQEGANTTTVQLNNLQAGIYYMNIETENAHTVRQIIKK